MLEYANTTACRPLNDDSVRELFHQDMVKETAERLNQLRGVAREIINGTSGLQLAALGEEGESERREFFLRHYALLDSLQHVEDCLQRMVILPKPCCPPVGKY